LEKIEIEGKLHLGEIAPEPSNHRFVGQFPNCRKCTTPAAIVIYILAFFGITQLAYRYFAKFRFSGGSPHIVKWEQRR
jgi:hypothetical protein